MIDQLRRRMAAEADPQRAAGMQAYMKSTMPYYGLRLPQVRAICREVLDGSSMTCDEWKGTIVEMWRGARRREERYAAHYLLTLKRHVRGLFLDTASETKALDRAVRRFDIRARDASVRVGQLCAAEGSADSTSDETARAEPIRMLAMRTIMAPAAG